MAGNYLQAILECGCCGTSGLCECDGRCLPLYADTQADPPVEVPGNCENPLPANLTCDLSVSSDRDGDTCFQNASTTLAFKTALSGGTECWEGTLSGSCTDCLGGTLNWEYEITVCCTQLSETSFKWTVSLIPINGTICPASTLSAEVGAAQCNPFMLAGCWPTFGACTPACFGPDLTTPEPSVLYDICFLIYES